MEKVITERDVISKLRKEFRMLERQVENTNLMLGCCRRASLSENRRRCVSEAAEVIWRKQNRVKEWP